MTDHEVAIKALEKRSSELAELIAYRTRRLSDARDEVEEYAYLIAENGREIEAIAAAIHYLHSIDDDEPAACDCDSTTASVHKANCAFWPTLGNRDGVA